MAAKLYSYGATSIISNIKAALNDKGLITAVHFEDANNIVFTTPLTSKVIKLGFMMPGSGDVALYGYFGDAWTSGTTITNQVWFGRFWDTDDYSLSGMDIIADTNFFAIFWKPLSNGSGGVLYIGALEDGTPIVFGYGEGVDQNMYGYELTSSQIIVPLGLRSLVGGKDASSNLFTMPLHWLLPSGQIIMNGTAPAGTVGVVNSTGMFGNQKTYYAGSTFYLAPPQLFSSTGQVFSTSMLFPYTP